MPSVQCTSRVIRHRRWRIEMIRSIGCLNAKFLSGNDKRWHKGLSYSFYNKPHLICFSPIQMAVQRNKGKQFLLLTLDSVWHVAGVSVITITLRNYDFGKDFAPTVIFSLKFTSDGQLLTAFAKNSPSAVKFSHSHFGQFWSKFHRAITQSEINAVASTASDTSCIFQELAGISRFYHCRRCRWHCFSKPRSNLQRGVQQFIDAYSWRSWVYLSALQFSVQNQWVVFRLLQAVLKDSVRKPSFRSTVETENAIHFSVKFELQIAILLKWMLPRRLSQNCKNLQ